MATDAAGTPPEHLSPTCFECWIHSCLFPRDLPLLKTGATLTWTLQVIPSTSSSSHTLLTGTKPTLVEGSTLQASLPSRAPLGRGRLKLVPSRDRELPQWFIWTRFVVSGFVSTGTDAKWLCKCNTDGEFYGIWIISQWSHYFFNTLFIYNKGFLLLFLFLRAHLTRVTQSWIP